MAEDLADYLSEMDVKVAYLHSEVETIERVEIIRDLRRGVYDVLVGINLLREGLDIPEVSLVAILDADREGFLRNDKSLIQTMGRATRNINGKTILYGDKITPSMDRAINETRRRRQIQSEYNQKNGIIPRTIQKEIHDILKRETEYNLEEEKIIQEIEKIEEKFPEKASKKQRSQILRQAMLEAAASMEFEKAALLRDRLFSIEGQGSSGVPKKKASRRGTLRKIKTRK